MGVTAAIRAVIALAILLIIVGVGWWITSMRADLATAQENTKKLTESVAQQQAVIDQQKQDIGQIQRANASLNNTIRRQSEDVQALQKKFSQDAQGNSRDFGLFASEKPELVERLVNRGTRNAYRCMELASGAPHTPEELAAKTSSEINKECPSIANPNYRPGTEVRSAAPSRVPEAKPDATPAPEAKPDTVTTRPPPPVRPPPPSVARDNADRSVQ